MPLHDLRCPTCETIYTDVLIPLVKLAEPDRSQGYVRKYDLAPLPLCTHDFGKLNPAPFTRMEILPPRVAVDIYESASTTCWVPDGRGGQVERQVHSLRDIRRIEAETAAAGRPMVWRDYNQDRSNRDKHTIMDDPSGQLSPAAKAKYAGMITRHGETEPTAELGPGVAESDATALADV